VHPSPSKNEVSAGLMEASGVRSSGSARSGKPSYGQILKSSVLIGGSSVLDIGFRIVRTKVVALLLGPTGIGLLGLYGSISEVVRSFAGMGINNSGVRQIAEAVGTGDNRRIAITVTTLRRVALVLGVMGALLLVIFCRPVSRFSFGDDRHAGTVALLALAVLFGEVSAAQGALVQGMRRISDLARMGVLSAFYGTLFSIPIVYFYGERGVVPSLVCVAAMSIITSWWYARKIKVEKVSITLRQVMSESAELLKLGVVFMASSLMAMAAAYAVRIIVLRKIGVEAAGFYQAAYALGGLYAEFILQAMVADFYPRLTAAAATNDRAESNRLVNEQAEMGLLMAGPGVLATLTLAPLVIPLFYSASFAPAVDILRWNCLGILLRIASWPMGFVLRAKGERGRLFWTEFFGYASYVGLVWLCVRSFGLTGTGVASFGQYLLYWLLIYGVVRRVSGFRWTKANQRIGLLFAIMVVGVFVAGYVLPRMAAMCLGMAATLLAGTYSLKTLCTLIPLARLPGVVQRAIVFFRLAPSNTNG
jgi:antigen flippase